MMMEHEAKIHTGGQIYPSERGGYRSYNEECMFLLEA
jgi:hypothetical protein